jgi:hypothetical protein
VVVNESDSPLHDVVVSGSGFSDRIGTIDVIPHSTRNLRRCSCIGEIARAFTVAMASSTAGTAGVTCACLLTGAAVLNRWRSGESISVIRCTTDPTGLQMALRNTTVYEGPEYNATLNQEAIQSGVRVAVWYRRWASAAPGRQRARTPRRGPLTIESFHRYSPPPVRIMTWSAG